MNICGNFMIECPYALSPAAPVPCVATKEECATVDKDKK